VPSANASAMARRVYDRTNDLASVAIRLSNHAANATAHADHHEPEEAIAFWREMQQKVEKIQPAVDALVEQLDEAIKETR
jgi:hypothetical protein